MTEPAQEIVLQEAEVEVEDDYFAENVSPTSPEIEGPTSLIAYDRREKQGRRTKTTRGRVRRSNDVNNGYDALNSGLRLKSENIRLDGGFDANMWISGKSPFQIL